MSLSVCFSKNDWVHFFWLYSMVVWPTKKTASALPDFSIFDWVHFKTWFFDGPTYDKFGLWSSRLSLIDWVHVLARLWPTTKTASALPDFSIFDLVHFKTWFFDGPTYDKFGLWSLWFSKNDGVFFFGYILW